MTPVRRVAVLALLGAAACHPAVRPSADVLVVGGGRVETYVEGHTYASTDAGATWTDVGQPAPVVRPVRAGEGIGRTACALQHCYRIAARDAVDESIDGGVTWHRSWRTPKADLRNRARRTTGFLGLHYDDGAAAAENVAFAGADVVLVAYGREGLLRRDGGGPWTRVAVGGAGPPAPAAPLLRERLRLVAVLAVAAFVLLLLVLGLLARRGRTADR